MINVFFKSVCGYTFSVMKLWYKRTILEKSVLDLYDLYVATYMLIKFM